MAGEGADHHNIQFPIFYLALFRSMRRKTSSQERIMNLKYMIMHEIMYKISNIDVNGAEKISAMFLIKLNNVSVQSPERKLS